MARKAVNAATAGTEKEATSSTATRLKAPVKKATRRKLRNKKNGQVRLKAYWGVFNQALEPVALFEYSHRKAADRKAAELTAKKNAPHFVQLVKRVIE